MLDDNTLRELIVGASVAAGVLLLAWAIRTLLVRRLRNAHLTTTDVDDFALDLARRSKLALLLLPALFLGARVLDLPSDLRRFLKIGASLSLIAQTALWASGVFDLWIRRYRRVHFESDPAASTTINLFRGAGIAAVWIVAIIVALANLNVEVTPLIASLGIGGVAVALALQNILGDLFASLSIVIDKPFVVGDAIGVDQYSGTVEHIGLKTTRVRSVSGEQLIFSNGDLLKSRIHNYKRITERRSLSKLVLPLTTSAEALARVPEVLRSAVERQTDARFDHAHLTAIAENGVAFELVYFVPGSIGYPRFLDLQQEVYLDVLRALESERIALVQPPATVRGTGCATVPPLTSDPPIGEGKERS